MIKIVFMGSPDFALPTLRALAEEYDVVGVVTQPDRASGRGRLIKSPPVKTLAQELNIPVIQPEKLKQPDAMEQLSLWAPDLIVVAAFGQILKKDVLDMPHFGCINVHASLLPRWRGAAPINAAILHGDNETGVTIMQMDVGLDRSRSPPGHPRRSTPDAPAPMPARSSRVREPFPLAGQPPYLQQTYPFGRLEPSMPTARPTPRACARRAR
jgi:methionyl-tRNA formyltransferase